MKNLKKLLLSLLFLSVACFAFSQTTDSTKNVFQSTDSAKKVFHFGGAALVTNNGLSLIPTFSLGKPAAIFDIYLGKGKLSFEPEFRFSLEGKPWSFLFWWRYKLVEAGKFRLGVGVHPALNFRSAVIPSDGDSSEVMVARRYLASEVVPNYLVSQNISVGVYYLYSHGLDPGTTTNTHFVTLNAGFTNIRVSRQLVMRVTPQFYYLKLDKQDGVYFSSAFGLAKKNFPLSISSIINKKIQSNISGSKDFVWNVSLIYSFYNRYNKI